MRFGWLVCGWGLVAGTQRRGLPRRGLCPTASTWCTCCTVRLLAYLLRPLPSRRDDAASIMPVIVVRNRRSPLQPSTRSSEAMRLCTLALLRLSSSTCEGRPGCCAFDQTIDTGLLPRVITATAALQRVIR